MGLLQRQRSAHTTRHQQSAQDEPFPTRDGRSIVSIHHHSKRPFNKTGCANRNGTPPRSCPKSVPMTTAGTLWLIMQHNVPLYMPFCGIRAKHVFHNETQMSQNHPRASLIFIHMDENCKLFSHQIILPSADGLSLPPNPVLAQRSDVCTERIGNRRHTLLRFGRTPSLIDERAPDADEPFRLCLSVGTLYLVASGPLMLLRAWMSALVLRRLICGCLLLALPALAFAPPLSTPTTTTAGKRSRPIEREESPWRSAYDP